MTYNIDNNFIPSIKSMPTQERPRERLIKLGPEVLKDSELIAILLGSGIQGKNALTLAEELLKQYENNIRQLAMASVEELMGLKGLGETKAVTLKAALELSKRLSNYSPFDRKKFTNMESVAEYLMPYFREYETEVLEVLLLNTKNILIKKVTISKGGLNGTMAAPSDVFRPAVRQGAHAVIICHNHPTGDPEPSQEDIIITRRLKESADLLNIRLLDHIIFGHENYVSLKDRGIL